MPRKITNKKKISPQDRSDLKRILSNESFAKALASSIREVREGRAITLKPGEDLKDLIHKRYDQREDVR